MEADWITQKLPSNDEIRRQAESMVRNSRRIVQYKKQACVSHIERYNYICRRLQSIWKSDNDLFVVAELKELERLLPESAKHEVDILINIRQ